MFPCILYFFIHSQPNNIGPARQQPRGICSLLISLSLVRGGGHSYYLLALWLLDYMGFAMEASPEWKMGGGGTHSSPTALGLGISASPHTHKHPKFPSFFVWDWEGAQKCFILRDQTTGDLKSHHLQARSHSQPCLCPPRPHFLSVIQVIFPNYALPHNRPGTLAFKVKIIPWEIILAPKHRAV